MCRKSTLQRAKFGYWIIYRKHCIHTHLPANILTLTYCSWLLNTFHFVWIFTYQWRPLNVLTTSNANRTEKKKTKRKSYKKWFMWSAGASLAIIIYVLLTFRYSKYFLSIWCFHGNKSRFVFFTVPARLLFSIFNATNWCLLKRKAAKKHTHKIFGVLLLFFGAINLFSVRIFQFVCCLVCFA